MLRLALSTALFVMACSTGTTTIEEQHNYSDGAGHACLAKLAKISPTAPVVSESVSCSGDGKECSAEATPCFQLNIDTTSYAIRNCPACCNGSAASFLQADCSPLVCETDADCVYTQALCVDGACTCPTGYCD